MKQVDALESLGERIVKTARLAVATHLQETTAAKEEMERMLLQQMAIGGAGTYLPRIPQHGKTATDGMPC